MLSCHCFLWSTFNKDRWSVSAEPSAAAPDSRRAEAAPRPCAGLLLLVAWSTDGGPLSPATCPLATLTSVYTETQAKWAAWWVRDGRSLPRGGSCLKAVGELQPPMCVRCAACQGKTVSHSTTQRRGRGRTTPRPVPRTWAPVSLCQDPQLGKSLFSLTEQDTVHG